MLYYTEDLIDTVFPTEPTDQQNGYSPTCIFGGDFGQAVVVVLLLRLLLLNSFIE